MRSLMTAGFAAAALSAGVLLGSLPVGAQTLSENSVRTLMDYAWAITPERFTKPDGVTILIDRNKRKEVEVPLDMAREVIRVGRLSSHAQVCELPTEQALNYKSLMLREAEKKKWSEQQMLYMNQLHLVTVMLLTGKLKLIERGADDKEIKVEPQKPDPAKKTDIKSCTPEQQAKVKQTIEAYVKTGPKIIVKEAAATVGTPPATPAAAKK